LTTQAQPKVNGEGDISYCGMPYIRRSSAGWGLWSNFCR